MRTAGHFRSDNLSDTVNTKLRAASGKIFRQVDVKQTDCLKLSKTKEVAGNDREVLWNISLLENLMRETDFR